MKQLLGAGLGAGLYVYSVQGSLDQGAQMWAYLLGLGIVALSLTSMIRGFTKWFPAYSRSAAYLRKSRRIARDDAAEDASAQTRKVSATVVVLSEEPLEPELTAVASVSLLTAVGVSAGNLAWQGGAVW